MEELKKRYQLLEILLEKVNRIGIELSIEKNISVLMEKILLATKEMTNAEGGTIYLFNKTENSLEFKIMINDVLKIHYGGTGGKEPPFPSLSILNEEGKVNENMVAAYCAGYKKKVNIKDAYEEKGFDFRGTKKFDQTTGYRSKSFLTIPMLDAKNTLLGVLQLINPRHEKGDIRFFNDFDENMVESLTSQASVALSNRILLEETRVLFESMINMINIALDEKSPYTNEHCQKVPILTMMITEAVCRVKNGPLKDFNLSEEEKNELRIAALLHDCGKIATPNHVIDKSKKLNLLADKTENIKLKAELVIKDMLINKSENKETSDNIAKQIKELEEDIDFIKYCNEPFAKINESDITKLQNIAKRWHYTDSNANNQPLLDQEELNFLSIPHGTLSNDERQIVNDHVIHSIKMLNSVPWPDNLKKVPKYAGSHHEKINGTGYPKGLTGDQMSVPSKILAIADVFEALTASTRPYKKATNLSESLKIMDDFVKNGHLDADIYKVFIEEKVYMQYAEYNIDKKQVDV